MLFIFSFVPCNHTSLYIYSVAIASEDLVIYHFTILFVQLVQFITPAVSKELVTSYHYSIGQSVDKIFSSDGLLASYHTQCPNAE